MSDVTNSFQVNFSVNCQQESIPIPLLSLCSLLIDGADPTPTNVSQQTLSGEACNSMRTCPHMRKSVKMCDK